MLKFRSVLIVCLVVISLCSYAQRDSTTNHKHFIGIGTEPFLLLQNGANFGFGQRMSLADVHIEYKHTSKYVNFRSSFEVLYQRLSIDRLVTSEWIEFYPSIGLERTFNPRSKIQFLYGIDMMSYFRMRISSNPGRGLHISYVGIGPLLGIKYKLARNIYMAHEISLVYGPRFRNSIFGTTFSKWWEVKVHKAFDITIYYGF